MSEKLTQGAILAAATAADAIAASMPNGGIAVPVGLTALLVLFGYDSDEARGFLPSLGFAATCGLSLAVAATPLQANLQGNTLGLSPALAMWLAGTVLFLVIELLRNSGRTTQPAMPSLHSMSAARPAAPFPASPVSASPTPVAPHLMRHEETSSERETRPAAPPIPPPAPVPPPPSAVPIKGGKMTTIYVNLVGEGMNMLRAVQAQSVGRDFYLITDEMPENERWEFGPGQVVRCQKRNLSSGKGLVATEEAPKAQ